MYALPNLPTVCNWCCCCLVQQYVLARAGGGGACVPKHPARADPQEKEERKESEGKKERKEKEKERKKADSENIWAAPPPTPLNGFRVFRHRTYYWYTSNTQRYATTIWGVGVGVCAGGWRLEYPSPLKNIGPTHFFFVIFRRILNKAIKGPVISF